MATYFNLGTEETPRWLNLESITVTSTMRVKAPGKSEVHFRSEWGQDHTVRGSVADRFITELEANPQLGKSAGV